MSTTSPRPTGAPHPAPSAATVDAALQKLVADGVLTADQARLVAHALAAGAAPAAETVASIPAPSVAPVAAGEPGGEPPPLSARLAEVAAYAGAALVATAAGLFLRTSWQTLSDAARVAWLAGIAAVLLLAGAVVLATAGVPVGQLVGELRAGRHAVRRRLASALWSLAAATAGAAVAVAVDARTPWPAAVVALVLLAPAYAVAPAAVGHLAAFAALVLAGVTALDEAGADTELPYALVLLGVAAIWVALTLTGVLRERTLGLAAATGAAFVGTMVPAGELPWLSHGLGALLAVALFLGYVVVREWPLLVGAVLTTTVVAAQVTSDLVGGQTSRAIVVLVAGLVLLGSSAVALRMRGPRGGAGGGTPR